MASVSVEHINTFLMAAKKILNDACQVDVTIGKPALRETALAEDSVVITVGLIGDMQGQVMMDLPLETACDIASKMCMMPIAEMNEISISALSELGNMIMGNAATLFSAKEIAMDITTPALSRGNEAFTGNAKNISVPLTYEGSKIIGLNISAM